MSFYLGKIKLPILEAGVRISRERESVNVPILNGETITIMGKKGLTQIEYTSMFPKQWGTYCDVSESQLKAPNKYKKLIEELRDNENYFLVRITELKYSQYCKIKSAEFSIENGIGDINYSIQLEEYNKLDISKTIYVPPVVIPTVIDTNTIQEVNTSNTVVAMTSTQLTGTPRESKTVKAQYYTTKLGDTLFSVARKFNIKFDDLYADNKSRLLNNYGSLVPGIKLFIRGTDTEQNKKIVKLDNGRTFKVNHS